MKPRTVDEYIAAAPKTGQPMARKIRTLIKRAAPDALERISYGMPYYSYHGRLVYWGVWQDHVGMYVMSAAREALTNEIEPYRKAKATLHFAFDRPLPERLITDLVRIQAAANKAKTT